MPEKMYYKELDHTADLRVEIYGKDLSDLLYNSMRTLYDLLGVGSDFEPIQAEGVDAWQNQIMSGELETLVADYMGNFLSLLLVEKQRVILTYVNVTVVNSVENMREPFSSYIVTSRGLIVPLGSKPLEMEIKAVTYHDIEVERNTKGEWLVRIVMDL